MKPEIRQWRTEDFAAMGWHDNCVHAFRIVEGEDGGGELLLDIDYIVEWLTEGVDIHFRVAPALLQFHQVTSLRVVLDYAKPTAGLTPFFLGKIACTEHRYPGGSVSYTWRLEVNWPEDEISFESPGFTQTLTGQIVQSSAQTLRPSQRGSPDGA